MGNSVVDDPSYPTPPSGLHPFNPPIITVTPLPDDPYVTPPTPSSPPLITGHTHVPYGLEHVSITPEPPLSTRFPIGTTTTHDTHHPTTFFAHLTSGPPTKPEDLLDPHLPLISDPGPPTEYGDPPQPTHSTHSGGPLGESPRVIVPPAQREREESTEPPSTTRREECEEGRVEYEEGA